LSDGARGDKFQRIASRVASVAMIVLLVAVPDI
jgi:hypothetical protein